MNEEKYCVVKGTPPLGFGDRLQCLLQAIQYCEVTNRTLVVDWRDSNWTQDQSVKLTDFFNIKKIKTQTIQDFLQYTWGSQSITPIAWKNKLADIQVENYIYETDYNHGDNSVFSEICKNKILDFRENIVVYPSVYFRSYNYSFFKYLEFNESIISNCLKILDKHNLKRGQYYCIHLRCQNKSWTQGVNQNQNQQKYIDDHFPTRDKYFSLLKSRHQAFYKNLPTIIISDSLTDSIYFNKNYFNNQCIIMDANDEPTGTLCGSHRKIFKDKKIKKQINMNALVDFHLMLYAKDVAHDGFSCFSKMAHSLSSVV